MENGKADIAHLESVIREVENLNAEIDTIHKLISIAKEAISFLKSKNLISDYELQTEIISDIQVEVIDTIQYLSKSASREEAFYLVQYRLIYHLYKLVSEATKNDAADKKKESG